MSNVITLDLRRGRAQTASRLRHPRPRLRRKPPIMEPAELRQRAQAILLVNRQGCTESPDPDAVDAMLADAVALAEGVLEHHTTREFRALGRNQEMLADLFDQALDELATSDGDGDELDHRSALVVIQLLRGLEAAKADIKAAFVGESAGLHHVTLTLDEAEQPQTVHELAHILLSWTDGPLPHHD